jgi:teichuronic acid biosynthesis glycosyltransferase TuaC
MNGRLHSRRLRVLMLSRSYPSHVFPNLGLWVERPTVVLNQHRDVEVHVVSPQPYFPPLPEIGAVGQYARFRRIPRRERRNGLDVTRPRYFAGPGRSTYRIESRAYEIGIRKAVDRLRDEFPFDVIHAHFIYPEGAVAHRLSRRYSVPFVVSEHAPWTRLWFGAKAVRAESLAAGRAAGSIMAVSNYVRRSITAWLGDTVPVSVVPTGMDSELFAPPDPPCYVEDQILFVGWPNFNKGVDVLLRAMQLVAQRREHARLLIVGGGYYRSTRLMERQIRGLAESLKLESSVTFTGPLLHDEVARLMSESAVLVLPSRSEASGTVLTEALACGTPVVATRSGGPEDYVTPEVGLLVPVDDPVALADALVVVLRERSRFDRGQLRRYALERFAWPRIVDGWLEAYARTLGRAAPVPTLAEGMSIGASG